MAQKGGGTRKVCLPASKVRSMSAAEKKKVVNAKEERLQKVGKIGEIKAKKIREVLDKEYLE